MPQTIYKISEQIWKLLSGADPGAASSISINELKISVGQVVNQLLKTEHFQVNGAMGETIPNGSVLGLYEGIEVTAYGVNKSKCTLPIKPLKLPRNMGVYAIYPKYRNIDATYDLDKEYIPLQMGQAGLLKSQLMINDLLGQVGYEVFGTEVIFTKNIKIQYPEIVVAMRLAIMDISLYDDYDILPILPEQEWEVIQQVFGLYMKQPLPDKLVDSTVQTTGIPPKQQQQN
jgi:hypothetical protein